MYKSADSMQDDDSDEASDEDSVDNSESIGSHAMNRSVPKVMYLVPNQKRAHEAKFQRHPRHNEQQISLAS